MTGLNRTLFSLLALSMLLFSTPAMSQETQLLFFDSFDGPVQEMDGVNGWARHYCEDNWQRGDGFASAYTDNGCTNQCCDYAVFTNDEGCGNSEPTDNFITVGSEAWTDYTLEVGYHHTDDDTIGAVFRYNNTANYYMFIMSRDYYNAPNGCSAQTEQGTARLYRVFNDSGFNAGDAEELDSAPYTYLQDEPGAFQIKAIGDSITISLDNNNDGIFGEIMSVSDSALPNGSVGLFMYESGIDGCDGACGFTSIKLTTTLSSSEEGGEEEGGEEEGGEEEGGEGPFEGGEGPFEGGEEEGGEASAGPCAANDHCGNDAPLFSGGNNGPCYCNDACTFFGDCCEDACDSCGFCYDEEEGGEEEGGEGPFEGGEGPFEGGEEEGGEEEGGEEEGGEEEGGEEEGGEMTAIGSCVGNCGEEVNPPGPGNTCYCDDICVQEGDCCFDACEECGYCDEEGGEGPSEEGGEGPAEEGGEGPAEEGGEAAEEGGEAAEEGGEAEEEGGEAEEEGGEAEEEGGEAEEEGGEAEEEGGSEEGGEAGEEGGSEEGEEGEEEEAEEEGGEDAEEEGGEDAEEEGGDKEGPEGSEDGEEEGGESTSGIGGGAGLSITAGDSSDGGCQSTGSPVNLPWLAVFAAMILFSRSRRNSLSS